MGGFGGAQEGVLNAMMVEEDIRTLSKAIKATQFGETTVDETLLCVLSSSFAGRS